MSRPLQLHIFSSKPRFGFYRLVTSQPSSCLARSSAVVPSFPSVFGRPLISTGSKSTRRTMQTSSSSAAPEQKPDVQEAIQNLLVAPSPGNVPWTQGENGRLERPFYFDGYESYKGFLNSVMDVSEAEGHHPYITSRFKIRRSIYHVHLQWFTHYKKVVTNKDVEMAHKTNDLAERWGSVALPPLPPKKKVEEPAEK